MSKKPGFLERFRARRAEKNRQDHESASGPEQLAPIGRRASQRVAAPVGLYYLIPPDRFVTLDLSLEIVEDGSGRSVPCFLFDVNETGLAFACEERIEPGSTVHIVGQLAKDLDPLVSCNVQVIDVRPFPETRPCPQTFQATALQVHGCMLELRAAMTLLRATLDCVAHQLKSSSAGNEADAESRTTSEHMAAPFTGGTEVSFASLPVASVEVIEAELRRHVERVGMSIPLGYVGQDNTCHRVELHIGRPEKGVETSAIGKLVDYSTDGACVETKRRYEVAETVKVIGTSMENGAVLFEDTFEIKNRRIVPDANRKKASSRQEFTFGATVDNSMEQHENAVYAYGLLHAEGSTNLLYKSIMDSVLLAKLNEGRKEPIRSLDDT